MEPPFPTIFADGFGGKIPVKNYGDYCFYLDNYVYSRQLSVGLPVLAKFSVNNLRNSKKSSKST